MDHGEAERRRVDDVAAEQHAVIVRRVVLGLSRRSLALVAFAAFGGPLALAALYAPGSIGDVTRSGGFVTIVATAAFAAPLLIWLLYARDIASPGGLSAYVEAAVGRPVALVQAAVWVASYFLYLLYTGAYVAYDVLPHSVSGVHRWRPLLAVAIPVAVAVALAAGRAAAVGVIGTLAVGQFAVLVLLDVVAVRHSPGANAFHVTTSADGGRAVGGIATLFVCGSLPLFLSGEVRDAGRVWRRVLPPTFALAAVGVLLAVLPFAHDPAFTRADVPGVALTRVDAGHAAGTVVGIGVAASIVAVLLLEGVALTRLLHWATPVSVRMWTWVLAAALVVVGPVSLALDPDKFYDRLLKPSLVLLWIAQLIVVAVFPVYAHRHGRLRHWHLAVTAVAVALMTFGLVNTLAGSSAS